MRRLVDAGWAPSTAAASIVAGTVPPDLDTPSPTNAPPTNGAGAPPPEPEAVTLSERLVRAARELDVPAVDRVLDDIFASASFERAASDLLFPALRRLGEAWAAGEVTVAGEHLASAAVLRRLGLALDAAGSAGMRGPTVVVGLPPGGRHELGALAFAVAARRAGMAVRYVCADLPIDDWVAATGGADAAVVGVVTAKDRRPAVDVAEAIGGARPDVVVVLGGHGAPERADVGRLDGTLSESVAALRAALDQRAVRAS